jgi:hypothetical protein
MASRRRAEGLGLPQCDNATVVKGKRARIRRSDLRAHGPVF